MQRRYVTADVFTDRVFGGNPLAVVLDAAGLSTAQMQALAREFAYSETTFVLPPTDPAHTAQVRIFTPQDELPFAGHPNVGTAVVLAHETDAREEQFLFEEGAGLVPLRLLRTEGRVVGAEFAAPLALSIGSTVPTASVAACLGLAEADICLDRFAPTVASVGLPFVICEVGSREALRRARPDAAAFAATMPVDGASAVFVLTREVDRADCDVMSRMFAPLGGILEDPATGSATAAAIGLLASLAATPGPLRFAQGVDMGRPSLLTARAVRDGGGIRAHVGGQAVAMFRGTLELAGEDA